MIKRCLEKDAKDRPGSALDVAMALPGGNPLQMALEAGQTPSPEMVAAAPKVGSLSPLVAFALLAITVLGFAFATATSKYVQLYRFVPLDKSADVLQERGRELVEKYGYPQNDSYGSFDLDRAYMDHLDKNDPSPYRWRRLAAGQPAVLHFWYRTSPASLGAKGGIRQVSGDDPPQDVPGMAMLSLDTKGRLIYFNGIPHRVDEPTEAAGDFNWTAIFKDAGFDLAAFRPVDPQWTPKVPFDDRRAFSGVYPDASDIPIRVETAAYRGKLVSFEIVEPWTKPPEQLNGGLNGPAQVISFAIFASMFFGLVLVSAWLAVKNIRGGRSDINGAIRIMLFLFAAQMISWILTRHHVGGQDGIEIMVSGIQLALYFAAVCGLMYLAFEPYMRKSTPERVISWNRLLAGGWRDPLVGRDLLIGAAAQAVFLLVYRLLVHLIPLWLGKPPDAPGMRVGPSAGLAGIGGFPGDFLADLRLSLLAAFLSSFLILFAGMLLRRKWLGIAVVFIVLAVAGVLGDIGTDAPALRTMGSLLFLLFLVIVPARFGVLAAVSFWLYMLSPSDLALGTWYTSYYAAYVSVLLALAVFGFYTSTAGQKLWQGKLLAESG